MKLYTKPTIDENANTINEPVFLGPWSGSPCYTGDGQVQQIAQLGNDNIRIQSDFLHDCTGFPQNQVHETWDQWIIVFLGHQIDERIQKFVIDSNYTGYVDDASVDVNTSGTRVRFKMHYHANPYGENLGIGDVRFNIIPWSNYQDEVDDICKDFCDDIILIQCYDPWYGTT